jgi:hypothetical protein
MENDLKLIVSETSRLIAEARIIKAISAPTITDLRRLVAIRLELTRLCPPERYAWADGLPQVDILAELVTMKGDL